MSSIEPREFRRHPFFLLIEIPTVFAVGCAALMYFGRGRTGLAVLFGVAFMLGLANCMWHRLTPAVRLTDRELICYPSVFHTPTSFDLAEIEGVPRAGLGGVKLLLKTGETVKMPGASFLSERKRMELLFLLRRSLEEHDEHRSQRSA